MGIVDKIMSGFKKDAAPAFTADKSVPTIDRGRKSWGDEQWSRYNKGARQIKDYVHGTSMDKMFPDQVKNGGYSSPKFDKFVSSFGKDSDFSKHLDKNLEIYQTSGKAYGSDYDKSFKGMTDILEKSVTEGSSYWDD